MTDKYKQKLIKEIEDQLRSRLSFESYEVECEDVPDKDEVLINIKLIRSDVAK